MADLQTRQSAPPSVAATAAALIFAALEILLAIGLRKGWV
jgi:hypothetical protein